MTGLGDRLKEARTTKGFTLDDLQSITKIQKRYLSGIENEDYSMMPGSFYVRAFIKQYAEAVDLDPDEMLSLYRENASTEKLDEEKQQLTTPALNRRSISRSNSRFSELMPKITAALFIIVIIAVAYFLILDTASKKPIIEDVGDPDRITMEDSEKPEVKPPDVETEIDEEEEPEIVEPEKALQTLTHVSISGEDSNYTLANAEQFLLEIRTTGDSWIGVLDETRKEWMTPARTMTSGGQVEFDVTATEFVRIRVGRSESTEIYVNGELLEYASDRITQNIIIKYENEQ